MLARWRVDEPIGALELIRRAAIGGAIILGIAVNFYGLATTLPHFDIHGAGDWLHLAGVDVLDPYATPAYRWAPPAIAIWHLVIEPLGFAVWTVLHVAVVFLIGSAPVIAVTLLSWPFWSDMVNGNTLTFVLVATVIALRDGPTLPFFALAVLMPRPLMLPAMLWLLWKRPDRRVEFLLVFAIVIFLSLPHLTAWVDRLAMTSPLEVVQPFNIGPSRVVGLWWTLIGLPIGVWLLRRGQVGSAGLAWSPYWLSYYLLMPLADWRPDQRASENAEASTGSTSPPSGGGTARPKSVPQ